MLRGLLVGAALVVAASCGNPGALTAAGPKSACTAVKVASQTSSLASTQTPTTGFRLEFGTQPVGLVLDRDGKSAWLLGDGVDRVMHVGADGSATTYQLQPSNLGIQLSQAADGTVWIPEQYRDAVMAIAPDGTARECHLPRGQSEPMATSVAADGSVWVSEARGEAIARLAGGVWTEHPIGAAGVKGAEVLAAPDGGAWFTVDGGPFLGRVSAAGEVTRIPIGGSGTTLGMLQTPDGAVWVADFGGDRVVRVAADRTTTAWQTKAGAEPQSLALAPDGTVWFTESGTDHLARIQGTQIVEAVKTGAWPDHMAIGADGWAWFTEYNQNALGRIRLS